jgi:hypothetical protein
MDIAYRDKEVVGVFVRFRRRFNVKLYEKRINLLRANAKMGPTHTAIKVCCHMIRPRTDWVIKET